MGQIKVLVDRHRRLTTHEVAGRITFEEIVSALERFYSHTPTLHILWDFSQADASGLTNEDVKNIMFFAKSRMHGRTGGKSALVGIGDLEYGLGRMYEILAEVYEHPIVHKVFRNCEEAVEWLLE